MVNTQLANYIDQQKKLGVPLEESKKMLLTTGWKEEDVNEAVAFLEEGATSSVVPVAAPVVTPTTVASSVESVHVQAISSVRADEEVVAPAKAFQFSPIASLEAQEPNPAAPETKVDTKPEEVAKPPFPKKGVIIPVVLLLIITLCVSLYYLPFILNYFTKQSPPLEYTDIQLSKVTVLDENNAYSDLEETKKNLYYPAEASSTVRRIIDEGFWDDQFVEDILSHNAEAFIHLNQAVNKPEFQFPQFADPATLSLNNAAASNYRSVGDIDAVYALYLSKNGNTKSAVDETLKLIRIGQKIEDSQASLIAVLYGFALKERGFEIAQKVIDASSTLSSEELLAYRQEFDTYAHDKDDIVRALKVQNYMYNNSLDTATIAIPFGDYIPASDKAFFFKKDKTKQLFADKTRKDIANVNVPCNTRVPNQVKDTVEKIESKPDLIYSLKAFTEENRSGKELFASMVADADVSALNCKTVDIPKGVAQITFSLKAFQNDTGELPLTLNELVPKYLPSIPLDPYDGKPLRYSKEKKILYSVGTSTEDVGGSVGGDWKTMKNPTFHIQF